MKISKKPLLRCEVSPAQNETKITLFKKLNAEFGPNAFVLIGNSTNRFKGAIAAPFKQVKKEQKQIQPKIQQNQNTNFDFVNIQQIDNNDEGINKQIIDVKLQQIKKNNTNVAITSKINISNRLLQPKENTINLDDDQQNQVSQWQGLDLPTINNDKKYYSYLFIFQNKKLFEEVYQKNFKKKLLEYQRNIPLNEICQPRIDTQSKLCWSCQKPYDDYLTHIQSYSHIEAMKKSIAYTYLKTLQTQLNVGEKKNQRLKQLKKQRMKLERKKKKEQNTNKQQTKKIPHEQKLKQKQQSSQSDSSSSSSSSSQENDRQKQKSRQKQSNTKRRRGRPKKNQ